MSIFHWLIPVVLAIPLIRYLLSALRTEKEQKVDERFDAQAKHFREKKKLW